MLNDKHPYFLQFKQGSENTPEYYNILYRCSYKGTEKRCRRGFQSSGDRKGKHNLYNNGLFILYLIINADTITIHLKQIEINHLFICSLQSNSESYNA